MLAPADKERWEAERSDALKKEQEQRQAEAEAANQKVSTTYRVLWWRHSSASTTCSAQHLAAVALVSQQHHAYCQPAMTTVCTVSRLWRQSQSLQLDVQLKAEICFCAPWHCKI